LLDRRDRSSQVVRRREDEATLVIFSPLERLALDPVLRRDCDELREQSHDVHFAEVQRLAGELGDAELAED
jgi:hypothetical protein